MGERALVTIRRVSDIVPIEGADLIELAKVDGWQCVVKKGEFKVGDLGVYFEIDSLLPIRPEFEFLKPSYRKSETQEGYRLKTKRMRGALSQGLLMPLSILEGVDITQGLGVDLWDPPTPVTTSARPYGNFPIHLVPKTDAARVQNCIELVKNLASTWELSEKVDGTSLTVYLNNKILEGNIVVSHVGVCSRNFELHDEDNAYWNLIRKTGINTYLKDLNRNMAIQGEMLGPGIQKNRYKLQEPMLYVFNMYNIDEHRAFSTIERMNFMQEMLSSSVVDASLVHHVPMLGELSMLESIDAVLDRAKGMSTLCPTARREGLVFKLVDDPIIQFKAINNEFLLHED